MNIWPSTVVFAPCCGSTRVAYPRPMVRETACPAKVSASKASCPPKPMATPISSSCTAANNPAPEKMDRATGIFTIGDTRNASDTDRMIFMKFGMVVSLATGADSTNPPTRNVGHHRRLTHSDTSAALRVTGCMRLADHRWNTGVQIAREIDQHAQDPRADREQGEDQQQQLGDEAQRGFVDLGRRLQHADDQSCDQRDQQQRSGHHRGHQQHAVRQIHDVFRGHWWKLEARVPIRSVHPSTTTNSMILNGRDTRT